MFAIQNDLRVCYDKKDFVAKHYDNVWIRCLNSDDVTGLANDYFITIAAFWRLRMMNNVSSLYI